VDTSLLLHFFGRHGNHELKYDDFFMFMDNLQTEVGRPCRRRQVSAHEVDLPTQAAKTSNVPCVIYVHTVPGTKQIVDFLNLFIRAVQLVECNFKVSKFL
jgi:hypothetical protein